MRACTKCLMCAPINRQPVPSLNKQGRSSYLAPKVLRATDTGCLPCYGYEVKWSIKPSKFKFIYEFGGSLNLEPT